MTVYIAMLAGAIMLMPLCSKQFGKTGRIIYCSAAALAVILISAVRYCVGYDYYTYAGLYFNMKFLDPEDLAADKMEKGFMLPMYFLNLFSENYQVIFIVTSVVIYAITFYLIYKRSSVPWISTAAFLCFGMYFNSLCFLRQVIAALIAMYAMKYAEEKLPWRFFVLVLAASAFHWSVLVLIPLYFLLRIKPSWTYTGIIAMLTVIFCTMSQNVMRFVVKYSGVYSNYDIDSNPEASTGLPPKYTIMYGILFLICMLLRKRIIAKNSKNAFYINCLMFTVVFEAMGTRHAVLSRLAIIVYMPALLFLLPDAVLAAKEYFEELKLSEWKKKGAAAAASLFAAGCYAMLLSANYNGVVPYVSQFSKTEDIFAEHVSDVEDDPDEIAADFDDDSEADTELDEEPEEEKETDPDAFNNEILDQLVGMQ